MAEISYEDARTLFEGCVINYQGTPCKVTRINEELVARLRNIQNGRSTDVKVKVTEFCNPLPRLGFMNHSSNGVAYVERKPVRRYQAGLNANNIRVGFPDIRYPDGADVVNRAVLGMECVEFSDMLLNQYPSFKEAIASVKEFGGSVAFDRQFAIDEGLNIYWKIHRVGSIPKNCSTVERIEFKKEYEELYNLIGNNYEKVA